MTSTNAAEILNTAHPYAADGEPNEDHRETHLPPRKKRRTNFNIETPGQTTSSQRNRKAREKTNQKLKTVEEFKLRGEPLPDDLKTFMDKHEQKKARKREYMRQKRSLKPISVVEGVPTSLFQAARSSCSPVTLYTLYPDSCLDANTSIPPIHTHSPPQLKGNRVNNPQTSSPPDILFKTRNDKEVDTCDLNVEPPPAPQSRSTTEKSVATSFLEFTNKEVDTHDIQACPTMDRSFEDISIGTHDSPEPVSYCSNLPRSEIIDLTSFNGFSYPEEAPAVMWPGGRFKTTLPFIPKKDSTKNILHNDRVHVEALARQAISDSPWVVHLKYNDYHDDLALSKVLDNELKWGKVIVLHGHPYKAAPLDPDALRLRFNFTKALPVECLDAEKRVRTPTDIHIKTTLGEFCKGVHDNSVVQCILDMPSLDGERPSFIKFLDDGHTSYNRVHNRFRCRKHIQTDIHKSASWTLLHQGLFFTYAHHDADGFMTWTQILSGYKIWTIIHPHSYAKDKSRKDLTKSADQFFGKFSPRQGVYGSKCDRIVIFGEPGDIIIMPPGVFHEVYTPIPSVTIGGHMYSYNTMHLTELCRSIQKDSHGVFTNQDHDSASITAALMMASLPLIPEQKIHRKPLIALCKMVLKPSDYTFQSLDFDVLLSNIDNLRKHYQLLASKKGKGKSRAGISAGPKKIEQSEDITEALKLANMLLKSVKQDKEGGDFIFHGDTFYDPLEIVDWVKAICEGRKTTKVKLLLPEMLVARGVGQQD